MAGERERERERERQRERQRERERERERGDLGRPEHPELSQAQHDLRVRRVQFSSGGHGEGVAQDLEQN